MSSPEAFVRHAAFWKVSPCHRVELARELGRQNAFVGEMLDRFDGTCERNLTEMLGITTGTGHASKRCR
jgi:hypothetical protein